MSSFSWAATKCRWSLNIVVNPSSVSPRNSLKMVSMSSWGSDSDPEPLGGEFVENAGTQEIRLCL